MKQSYLSNRILLLVCLFLFISTSAPRCEYYEYTDKNGVKCYTDDSSRIPAKETDKVRVHKEKYDDLSDEEKAEKLKTENQELLDIRAKQEAYSKKHDEEQKIEEQAEAEAAKKKQLEKLKTPVRIINNQIFVPVTIGYGNKTVSTTLLLDTGATITTLNKSIADALNITTGKVSASFLANGSIEKTTLVDVTFIKVGPKIYKSLKISIFPYMGHPADFHGLLGINFLKNFQYSIDYKNSMILWKE